MILNHKTVFLFDGVGALMSALILGVVLPAYQEFIGMPAHILYVLCSAPAVFSIYDFYAFKYAEHEDPKWFKRMIIANVSYCVVAGFLFVRHFGDLTGWGVAFFLGEQAVLMALVYYERLVFIRLFESAPQSKNYTDTPYS